MMIRVVLSLLLLWPFAAAAEEKEKGAPKVLDDFYAGDAAVSEARKLMAEQKCSEAVTLLEQSLRRNMRNTDVHMMLATCWYNLGNTRKAKESLTNTLMVDRGHRGAYVMMGFVALRERDLKQAEYYLSALKVVCGGETCAEYHTLKNAISETKE